MRSEVELDGMSGKIDSPYAGFTKDGGAYRFIDATMAVISRRAFSRASFKAFTFLFLMAQRMEFTENLFPVGCAIDDMKSSKR
jgi:hypothetical protein